MTKEDLTLKEKIENNIHPITGYKYDKQKSNKKPRVATRRFSEHYY